MACPSFGLWLLILHGVFVSKTKMRLLHNFGKHSFIDYEKTLWIVGTLLIFIKLNQRNTENTVTYLNVKSPYISLISWYVWPNIRWYFGKAHSTKSIANVWFVWTDSQPNPTKYTHNAVHRHGFVRHECINNTHGSVCFHRLLLHSSFYVVHLGGGCKVFGTSTNASS